MRQPGTRGSVKPKSAARRLHPPYVFVVLTAVGALAVLGAWVVRGSPEPSATPSLVVYKAAFLAAVFVLSVLGKPFSDWRRRR